MLAGTLHRLRLLRAPYRNVRSNTNLVMDPKKETKVIQNEAGIKVAELEMIDGKPHGTTRQWTETGVLTLEAEMDKGHYHGPYKSWWANGNLKEVGKYQQGKRVGLYQWYKPTGEIWNEHSYE